MLLIWLGDHGGGAVVTSKGWPGDLTARRVKDRRRKPVDQSAEVRKALAEAQAELALAELEAKFALNAAARAEAIRRAEAAMAEVQAMRDMASAMMRGALAEIEDDEETVEMLLLHS